MRSVIWKAGRLTTLVTGWRAVQQSVRVFVDDVGHGLLEVSHNTLALIGLLAIGTLLFLSGRADLRHDIEVRAFDWLEARHEAQIEPAERLADELSEPDAIARATAATTGELTRQQGSVALWLAHRYRVAPEPLNRLVKEAWAVGAQAKIEPTLILAVMAVESSFNPFAQSAVGAQGLMQVMTRVHDDKYVAFGGNLAAFDPVTNLRVGAQVLRDCMQRAGGVEAGLRSYVGSTNLIDDSGYASRVLAEQANLRLVANGKAVPVNVLLPGRPVLVRPKVDPEIDPDLDAGKEKAAAVIPERVAS